MKKINIPVVYNREFASAMLSRDTNCEFLAYIGCPMLYDGDLYVLRNTLKNQVEYYRWVRGIRAV